MKETETFEGFFLMFFIKLFFFFNVLGRVGLKLGFFLGLNGVQWFLVKTQ